MAKTRILRLYRRWLGAYANFYGAPAGYNREDAHTARSAGVHGGDSHLDATELQLLIDGIHRGQSGEVPFEVALGDCRQAIDAHRALHAA